MVKITLKIDGMACGMCESHVNDTVRKHFAVKKVSSSNSKGLTEIIADNIMDEDALRAAIGKTGYTVLSVDTEPYIKKASQCFIDNMRSLSYQLMSKELAHINKSIFSPEGPRNLTDRTERTAHDSPGWLYRLEERCRKPRRPHRESESLPRQSRSFGSM